jgi:hypothetical protein
MAANLELVTTLGSSGSEDGEFSTPEGMAMDDGLLYVADSGNNRITIHNLVGGAFLNKITGLDEPDDIVVVGGNLIIANTDDDEIRVYHKKNLRLVHTVTENISAPTSLCVDGIYLYSLHVGNDTILVHDLRDWSLVKTISLPSGTYGDITYSRPAGLIYVVDQVDGDIYGYDLRTYKIVNSGDPITTYLSGFPRGIAFDGTFLVTITGTEMQVRGDGNFTLVAQNTTDVTSGKRIVPYKDWYFVADDDVIQIYTSYAVNRNVSQETERGIVDHPYKEVIVGRQELIVDPTDTPNDFVNDTVPHNELKWTES